MEGPLYPPEYDEIDRHEIGQHALKSIARAVGDGHYHSAACALRWALKHGYTARETWRDDVMASCETVIQIFIIWTVDDVYARAHETGMGELTEDEAIEVLYRCKDGYDASIGINWDVLDVYIEDVINYRQEEK